jgi:hypothetical protein
LCVFEDEATRSSKSLLRHRNRRVRHALCYLIYAAYAQDRLAPPMLASALVILGIVYSKLVTSNCPDVELCRGSDFANSTSNHVYYVDYPAARLAFISSWSSTVSFALVSFLMAFSAYINAAELLGASESGEQDSLPTPHQMSVLLRVLNAELMVLWDLAALRVKSVFWRAEKDSSDPTTLHQTSPILSTSITILLGGIVAR